MNPDLHRTGDAVKHPCTPCVAQEEDDADARTRAHEQYLRFRVLVRDGRVGLAEPKANKGDPCNIFPYHVQAVETYLQLSNSSVEINL